LEDKLRVPPRWLLANGGLRHHMSVIRFFSPDGIRQRRGHAALSSTTVILVLDR
jgi:hypothetical protein